jgi:hypothetical protein
MENYAKWLEEQEIEAAKEYAEEMELEAQENEIARNEYANRIMPIGN